MKKENKKERDMQLKSAESLIEKLFSLYSDKFLSSSCGVSEITVRVWRARMRISKKGAVSIERSNLGREFSKEALRPDVKEWGGL